MSSLIKYSLGGGDDFWFVVPDEVFEKIRQYKSRPFVQKDFLSFVEKLTHLFDANGNCLDDLPPGITSFTTQEFVNELVDLKDIKFILTLP